jgi:hypothetical protein
MTGFNVSFLLGLATSRSMLYSGIVFTINTTVQHLCSCLLWERWFGTSRVMAILSHFLTSLQNKNASASTQRKRPLSRRGLRCCICTPRSSIRSTEPRARSPLDLAVRRRPVAVQCWSVGKREATGGDCIDRLGTLCYFLQ